MENGHAPCLGADAHVAGRIVYAVADIAVFQIIHDLFHGHHGAVVLGFLGAGAQMRNHNTSLLACRGGIGKIGHIAGNLAALQTLQHIFFVGQKISGKVQQYHALLHLGDGYRIDHALGGIQQGHMDGDIVTVRIDIVHIQHMLHGTAQIPRGVHGQVGIIAVYIHSQRHGGVGHFHTDGPQADNAQLFAHDFCPGKVLLLLLRRLGNVPIVRGSPDPVDAADHIPGCQQHSCQHPFLHAVGVGAGSIEYHHALFRTFVQRDIIHPCAGTGHCQQPCRYLHLMHGSAAHQNAVSLLYIRRNLIFIAKILQSHIRNGIQAINLIHQAFSSSNFFINSTSFSTPSMGMAL